MWIMARNTTESAVTRAETPADLHLRDVPHGLGPFLLGAAINRVKLEQGKPRAIVEFIASEAADPLVAQKVALLTDGRAECRRKVPWIDDRQVPAVDHFLPAQRATHPGRGTARSRSIHRAERPARCND